MTDATLALMGACAGIGSAVGAWVALWWRDRAPTTHRAMIRRIYRHVDDLLGATKTENQIRAGKRHHLYRRLWFLPKASRLELANFFWPTPQLGTGTAALPSTKRMAAYVRLEIQAVRPWWTRLVRPFHAWDVGAVTVWWTSESNPLTGKEFGANVGRKVAQALRLESVDQLSWDIDYDLGCITYARKAPAPEIPTAMPVGVNADA